MEVDNRQQKVAKKVAKTSAVSIRDKSAKKIPVNYKYENRKPKLQFSNSLSPEHTNNLKKKLFDSLRPKFPQAAIPRKEKDFFACIRPMNSYK